MWVALFLSFSGAVLMFFVDFFRRRPAGALPVGEAVTLFLGVVVYVTAGLRASTVLGSPVVPLVAFSVVMCSVWGSVRVPAEQRALVLVTFLGYSFVALLAVMDGARREDEFGAMAVYLGGALIQAAANILAAESTAVTEKPTARD